MLPPKLLAAALSIADKLPQQLLIASGCSTLVPREFDWFHL